MSVRIAGILFDRVVYDRAGDVLYLHVGDPAGATGFDETPEGHHVRYANDGEIVGLTLVRLKRLLETEGEVKLTLSLAERVDPAELAPILA